MGHHLLIDIRGILSVVVNRLFYALLVQAQRTGLENARLDTFYLITNSGESSATGLSNCSQGKNKEEAICLKLLHDGVG
jgi:hypothetical protein